MTVGPCVANGRMQGADHRPRQANFAMNQFAKLGAFLSDCPADDAVLESVGHLAGLRPGDSRVYCVHVQSDFPSGSVRDPEPSEFEARIRKALPADVFERTECLVQTSHGVAEVLRVARDRDLDLAVMGRYLPSSQMGLGGRLTRVVRKCPCSVLVVPDQWRPHFARIQVAVDGSKHSELSLQTAIALARHGGAPNAELVIQTVRHVDVRHDLAGATFKESADAQRAYGRQDLERFLSGIDTQGLPVETVVSLSESPAHAIVELAMARKMDIVVVGSRGATRAAAVILGSTSEQVLNACGAPVMIVKEKGETLHLLEALFAME